MLFLSILMGLYLILNTFSNLSSNTNFNHKQQNTRRLGGDASTTLYSRTSITNSNVNIHHINSNHHHHFHNPPAQVQDNKAQHYGSVQQQRPYQEPHQQRSKEIHSMKPHLSDNIVTPTRASTRTPSSKVVTFPRSKPSPPPVTKPAPNPIPTNVNIAKNQAINHDLKHHDRNYEQRPHKSVSSSRVEVIHDNKETQNDTPVTYQSINDVVFRHNYTTYPNFTKVLVSATYKEYVTHGMPPWVTNTTIQDILGYSVFLYQRLNESEPNYVRNRGTEGAVFLRYIVDHYDNFPDVAIFVHALPHHHNPLWWEQIGCIKPTASYMNINSERLNRNTDTWHNGEGIWVEQCWRDVLSIVWDTPNISDKLPPQHSISVSISCCQQFIMSRQMVQKRPLSVWKALLKIINEQDACHLGEPDYIHLHAYLRSKRKFGLEPSIFMDHEMADSYGRATQGGAMEHLSHVVFGGKELHMAMPTMDEICTHYESKCPFSPCRT